MPTTRTVGEERAALNRHRRPPSMPVPHSALRETTSATAAVEASRNVFRPSGPQRAARGCPARRAVAVDHDMFERDVVG